MKRDSNVYIFLYSAAMVVLGAVLLAVAATALKPEQLENKRMEKRLDILNSIRIQVEVPEGKSRQAYVAEQYDRYIRQAVLMGVDGRRMAGDAFDVDLRDEMAKPESERHLPIFVATLDDGSTKFIFPLSGQGLWGAIWGYMALDDDLSTVYGVSFAHKSETPGLGADIALPSFQQRFQGKQMFDGDRLVSIQLLKRGAGNNPHAVDGISGGTMTSKGVEAMLMRSLAEYEACIAALKREGMRHE